MKKEDLSAAISDIYVSFIEEAENYDMSKRKIIKRPLGRMAVAAIVIGCLVFGGIAYAGTTLTDWKSVISFFDDKGNKVDVTVSDEAFFKELPDGLPVPGDGEPMIPMTRDEVEGLLGFDILGSKLAPVDIIYNYDAYVNKANNNVALVTLWCPNFIKENETKRINYSVDILSTDAEEGYILPFIEGKDAMGEKKYIGAYELVNLSVCTVIYTSDWKPERLTATFVYDNLYYSFIADNYELEEFVDILKTLI